MIDSITALLASGKIQQFAWATVGKILTKALIDMAKPRDRPTLSNGGFKQRLVAGLMAAIQVEIDPAKQLLLARCLCDELTLQEITLAFASGKFSEEAVMALVVARQPEASSPVEFEDLLRRAIHSLVERFKDSVADDQFRFNRTMLDRTEQTSSNEDKILEGIESIQQSLAAFSSPETQNSGAPSSVSTASRQLSSISGISESFPEDPASNFVKSDFERGLAELKNGSAQKAREVFAIVVERLESLGVENHRNLYFRSKSNLGIASYLCGEAAGFAAACLEDAFPYSDGSLKGRTNKALVFSLRGDDGKALIVLDGILVESPGHFDAASQKADCLGRLGRDAEALSALQGIAPENLEQKNVLGMTLLGLHDYEGASAVAEAILDEAPDNPWAKQMLAEAIATPLINRFNADKITSRFRSPDHLADMQKAIALLEDALVGIRRSERPAMIAATLSNLCGFCCAAGEIDKSLRYSEEAAIAGNLEEPLLRNRYLAAMRGGQYELALSTAEALGCHMPPEESLAMRLEALKALRRHPEALKLVQDAKLQNSGILPSAHLRMLEVGITLELPDIEAAEQLGKQLTADFPEDTLVWLVAADIARERKGQSEEGFLQKAIACAVSPGLKMECLGMLGVFYGKQGKWLESLDCFLPAGCGANYRTPYLVEAATCCFNLGRHQQSLELSSSRLDQGYDSAACDLAIQSCLAMFELEKAKDFANRMRREDPRNETAAWAYLAHLEFRLGKPEAARKLLVAALQKGGPESKLLILLSNVCLRLGRHEESLKHAFHALQLADEQHLLQAHRTVMSVAFSLPENFKVSRSDRRKIRKSLLHMVSVEGSGLVEIPMDHDFGEIRKILRLQEDAAKEGHRMFSEKGFPVYVLAKLSGHDLYDIWRTLTSGQGFRVNMAEGSREEQDSQFQRALDCDGIVVDATALFTFHSLGLLDVLPIIFRKIVVSFPTFEYLRDLLDAARHGPPTNGTLALEGEGFRLQQFEPGSRERDKQEFLAPILQFLNSPSVEKRGFSAPEERNEAADVLGLCSPQAFATLVVAKTTGLPVLCDDTGTLQIAKSGFNIQGFCSQAALRAAVSRLCLRHEIYADAVVKLFESNYHFVSEDADCLITHLSQKGWELTPTIVRMFERFDNGTANEQACCTIMGHVVAHAWMRARGPVSDSVRWLNFICERLRANGTEYQNLRWALVAAAITFIEVPECFFAMTRAMQHIGWLPETFKRHVGEHAASIASAIATNGCDYLGPAAPRWSAYVR